MAIESDAVDEITGVAAPPQDFKQNMADSILLKMRALLEPFESKFYGYGYVMMFLRLIATPGMKKSEIALFLENEAKVSRSTAERFIREAADAGYIVVNNSEDRPGLEVTLSEQLTEHFEKVFHEFMDRTAPYLENQAPTDDEGESLS